MKTLQRKLWLTPVILALLVALVALGGAAATPAEGTQAWFTDQELVVGNSFTAGKLDIKINPGCGIVLPVTVQDMEPGKWYGPYDLEVYNQNTPVSTMPVKYRMYSSNESGTLMSKLNVRVAHSNCVGCPRPDWTANPALVKYAGNVQPMYVDSPTHSITAPTGNLDVNITHCWQLSFQVDTSAGNGYQGTTASFDLVVDATQVGNPGWSQ